MRPVPTLTLFALLVVACGGDADPDARAPQGTPAAETGPVPEQPGLPMDSTSFRETSWGQLAGEGVEGRLWVSTAPTIDQAGMSLTAQLEGLSPDNAYSWALHRGDCSQPDDRVAGLGYGAVADVEGRGPEEVNGGGPVGEMPLTFTPLPDGTAEEIVFVPLGDEITRAELERAPHSVRLHPNVRGEDPGASVACAPLPALPRE